MSNQSSKEQVFPTPWRVQHDNVPIADTGDYDCLTRILAANDGEVAELWNPEDERVEAFELIVRTMNAVETSARREPLSAGFMECRAAETTAPRTDHAENLAKAVEAYIAAAAKFDADGTLEQGQWDAVSDTWGSVKTAAYEYRKHSPLKAPAPRDDDPHSDLPVELNP